MASAVRWVSWSRLRRSENLGFVLWMLLRVGALAATVVLTTAVLGLEAYGRLITALAIGSMLSPLAGLGLHMRIMTGWRAAEGRHRAWLGGLMGEWLLASSLLAVLGCVGYAFWAGSALDITTPFKVMGPVLALEILAASGIEWMARASLMRGGTAQYARTLAGFPLARLVVLLPCLFFDQDGLRGLRASVVRGHGARNPARHTGKRCWAPDPAAAGRLVARRADGGAIHGRRHGLSPAG